MGPTSSRRIDQHQVCTPPMIHEFAVDARARPSVIVFDVNETLIDLTTLEPLFVRLFGEAAVMREWFAQLIL